MQKQSTAAAYSGQAENAEYQHVGIVRRVLAGGEFETLNPRYDLANHSPDGFAWSYGGSGPAQLALAILADVTGDDEYAVHNYQAFKFDKIATLPRGDFTIERAEVLAWIEARKAPA